MLETSNHEPIIVDQPHHLFRGTDGENYWIYEKLPDGTLRLVRPKTPISNQQEKMRADVACTMDQGTAAPSTLSAGVA